MDAARFCRWEKIRRSESLKMSRLGFLALLLTCISSLPVTAEDTGQRINEPSSCATLPCVVASISLQGQTAPVAETAVFIPSTSGLFRITAYIESSAMNGSQWGLQFKYTDDLRGRSAALYQVHPGDSESIVYNIRDVAGQPINYTVSELKNWTGGSYDLFITVEEIQ
jgi:hypothetical protein